MKYSYSDFKIQRSAFWRDVPHHKSKPSRQKLQTANVYMSSLINKLNNNKKGSRSLKSAQRGNSGKVGVSLSFDICSLMKSEIVVFRTLIT